ncbi:MAG: phage tail family protein [Oscillospiraceae bacterium]|nr:phage tail family protein [Oscillospiraceae bacterium]
MITTGFTFNSGHSQSYGIVVNPTQRIILPEKRRVMIEIPGRSGYHSQSDGTYLAREETFHCYYVRPENISLADSARRIALWLSGEGRLEFDNEPGKYYDAFVVGAPPQIRHLQYGEFDVTFCYSPPFAYTEIQQESDTIVSNSGYIFLPVNGTADTPCRIIIKNVGTRTINNLRVTRSVQ